MSLCKRICSLFLVAFSLLSSRAGADEPLWKIDELRKPPKVEWVDSSGPLRKLYYESEPRNGKPTRVFAYCAFPEKIEGRAPAMVLIHGGGGTAFPEWATLWAQRGYVAIAMDLAGKGPDRQPLADGGPDQSDDIKFPKGETPLTDIWTYHSVAAAVRAGSLLANLPEVDSQKIGVTGISWGGYLTCIVAGVDDRFRAAVPVYGCGFLHEDSVWLPRFAAMEPAWREKWIRNFDPSLHVGRAKMPVLFVNGTNDFAYPLGSYQKTYRLVKDHQLCVTVNMPHGHPQGWAPQEIGLFIDQHVRGGEPLPRVEQAPVISDDQRQATLTITSAKQPTVKFHWTNDEDPWQKRSWQTKDVSVKDSKATIALPDTRPLVGFFTVQDNRKATVSSEHFSLK